MARIWSKRWPEIGPIGYLHIIAYKKLLETRGTERDISCYCTVLNVVITSLCKFDITYQR